MDLQKLLDKVPYVYHLTSQGNLPSITGNKILQSTTTIVNNSNLNKLERVTLLHNRSHTIFEC